MKTYDVHLSSNPSIHQVMNLETIVQFQSFLQELATNVGIACLTHEYAKQYVVVFPYHGEGTGISLHTDDGPATHLGIDFGHEAITLLNIQQRTSHI